tara:strand:+ start:1727 stop:3526 length:1800 start_codon:yes stop_codon:yes gene_type:complete
MIVTKSDIESIIEEELKAYLKEASLPRGAIELPGDSVFYYILSPDKKSYDAYKREGNKLARKGITDAESLGKVLKAAGEEGGPGVLQSIYNYIFGQEGIQYYKGLPENLKTAEEDIKAGKKSNVLQCKDRGCAQWVSDTLKTTGGSRGNAWHQHRLSQVKYSAFKNISKDLAIEATELFANIRAKRNSDVEKFVKKLIPDQSMWQRALKLGDIVGLYYQGSSNFKAAFKQGATGMSPNQEGGETKAGDGPFFVQKGGKWVPGNTILSGKGFGMNTHLGFVGAISNGEPVIFHQAEGTVKAEPLSYIKNSSGRGSIKIMWNKSPQVLSEEKGSMAQRPTKADVATSKINDTNLPDNIKNAVLAVTLSQGSIMKSLGIDKQTLRLLTNAAVGVTGRESDFGKGKRYNVLKWVENMASITANNPITKSIAYRDGALGWLLLTVGDTSIGPAQVRYGQHFGDEDAELADYAKKMEIQGAMSVTNYSKAVIAAIGILALLYKKAAKIGYSTDSPGVSRQKFTSTGRAALDMALVGYNTSPDNVTSYCGTDEIKKKCEETEQEPVAQNYIPAFKTPRGDSFLTSLGYISEVAQNMKTYKEIYRLF